MAKKLSFSEWLRLNEVLGYIINSHMGADPVPGKAAVMRRVFMWQEADKIIQGNTEAFVLHLGEKFDRKVRTGDANLLHSLMRDLGECITTHRPHSPRSIDGPKAGKFKQPDPDSWTVGAASLSN